MRSFKVRTDRCHFERRALSRLHLSGRRGRQPNKFDSFGHHASSAFCQRQCRLLGNAARHGLRRSSRPQASSSLAAFGSSFVVGVRLASLGVRPRLARACASLRFVTVKSAKLRHVRACDIRPLPSGDSPAKSHARLVCSFVNALTTIRRRYQLFCGYCGSPCSGVRLASPFPFSSV